MHDGSDALPHGLVLSFAHDLVWTPSRARARCVRLGADTCCRQFSALRYLHDEMRVVHRDVKPANIVLLHTGTIQVCASVRPAANWERSQPNRIGFADSFDVRS